MVVMTGMSDLGRTDSDLVVVPVVVEVLAPVTELVVVVGVVSITELGAGGGENAFPGVG